RPAATPPTQRPRSGRRSGGRSVLVMARSSLLAGARDTPPRGNQGAPPPRPGVIQGSFRVVPDGPGRLPGGTNEAWAKHLTPRRARAPRGPPRTPSPTTVV